VGQSTFSLRSSSHGLSLGEELLNNVMDMLLNQKLYSARRGAAYGLGGVVKGLGVVVMKKHEVRETLLEAMQDKVSALSNRLLNSRSWRAVGASKARKRVDGL
jgi:uncharacterized protein YaaR (DUF327 family)